MKAFSRFALICLIILTAVLLGAWTYLTIRYGSVEQFLAGGDGPRYWQPSPSAAHEETEGGESEAEHAAAEIKRGKKPPDSEIEGDWRRAVSGAPVKPKEGGTAVPAESVEASADDEFSELAIEIDDESLTQSRRDHALRPFFARTVPELDKRIDSVTTETANNLSGKTRPKSSELVELERAGRVIVHGVVREKQKKTPVVNAVVVPVNAKSHPLAGLRAVTSRKGDFVLIMSKEEARDLGCGSGKLRALAIADGMKPVAAKESTGAVLLSADENNSFDIAMEPSRGLKVRVKISNPRPKDDRVRVWCELRSDANGPLFDDHIFMSVDAPQSGDVVFRMPRSSFGTVRIGACGNGWASEIYETDNVKNDTVAMTLTLSRARTEYVRGVVCKDWGKDGSWASGVYAARVNGQGNDLTYTDVEGRFEFSMRFPGEGIPHVQVWHVDGFERDLELLPVSRNGEEKSLVRVLPASGSYIGEWQILVPAAVELSLALPRDASVLLAGGDAFVWAVQRKYALSRLQDYWDNSYAIVVGKPTDDSRDNFIFTGVRWASFEFAIADKNFKTKHVSMGRVLLDTADWKDAAVAVTMSEQAGKGTKVALSLRAKNFEAR